MPRICSSPEGLYIVQLHEQLESDVWTERMAALQKYSKAIEKSAEFPPGPEPYDYQPQFGDECTHLSNWIDPEANDPLQVPMEGIVNEPVEGMYW